MNYEYFPVAEMCTGRRPIALSVRSRRSADHETATSENVAPRCCHCRIRIAVMFVDVCSVVASLDALLVLPRCCGAKPVTKERKKMPTSTMPARDGGPAVARKPRQSRTLEQSKMMQQTFSSGMFRNELRLVTRTGSHLKKSQIRHSSSGRANRWPWFSPPPGESGAGRPGQIRVIAMPSGTISSLEVRGRPTAGSKMP